MCRVWLHSGRSHYVEHYSEITLNLGQWLRKCPIFIPGCHFVQQSETICAILVEGIMRNISVKLFEFGPVVQEQSFFLFLALVATLFSIAELFVQLY